MLFGQDLLEKLEGPWVVRLSEPENRLAAHLGILIGLRQPDQDRNTLIVRQLRQGKHRMIAYVSVLTLRFRELGESFGGLITRDLTQPEHRIAAHALVQVIVL